MIELLSVNVGRPAPLGQRRGRTVLSGIRKSPLAGLTVEVQAENILGDQQADLVHHGGRDKAIFAYPQAHLDAQADQYGTPEAFTPGNIGDNLTIGNLLETDVCIGDIWQWGEVELQISQPRIPCYKLAMSVGNPKIVKRWRQSGSCGWYIRVLIPGTTSIDTPLTIKERDSAGITVREAALVLFQDSPLGRRREIADHPALSAAWRDALFDMIAMEKVRV
jgi:MOSC domain-containing protein YiiM